MIIKLRYDRLDRPALIMTHKLIVQYFASFLHLEKYFRKVLKKYPK